MMVKKQRKKTGPKPRFDTRIVRASYSLPEEQIDFLEAVAESQNKPVSTVLQDILGNVIKRSR